MAFKTLVTLASCLFSVLSITEWELLAHGSDRTEFTCQDCSEWSIKTNEQYHFCEWVVPYGLGQTLPGGIAQRTSDGHIHLQLLGTKAVNIGNEWPGKTINTSYKLVSDERSMIF